MKVAFIKQRLTPEQRKAVYERAGLLLLVRGFANISVALHTAEIQKTRKLSVIMSVEQFDDLYPEYVEIIESKDDSTSSNLIAYKELNEVLGWVLLLAAEITETN